MYLRLTIKCEYRTSLKTVDLNIDHIVYDCIDNSLFIYDKDLSIFQINLSLIYHFAIIIASEAGVDYKCYNNLNLAFTDLGLKEVQE